MCFLKFSLFFVTCLPQIGNLLPNLRRCEDLAKGCLLQSLGYNLTLVQLKPLIAAEQISPKHDRSEQVVVTVSVANGVSEEQDWNNLYKIAVAFVIGFIIQKDAMDISAGETGIGYRCN